MRYRNAAHAFAGELSEVARAGTNVTVRGAETRELLARTIQLTRPVERCITIPGRRNDIFAAIAETMWVIAGRADIAYLGRYLPRASEFSDDGVVWRGAYGPRLRNWGGVDQITEVRQLLDSDPLSRRGVLSIYDPGQDFVDTKDVPCNNWLHFLRRGDRLDLNVVIRSNDLVWGFSGINTFEWSVLHEMMSHWLGANVGTATFFVSSLHYYLARDSQVQRTLDRFTGRTGYEDGWVSVPFATSWSDFPAVLDEWFQLELALRDGKDVDADIVSFPDPLLRSFLQAIRIKWRAQAGADENTLRRLIEDLGHTDLALAVREHLFRDSTALLPGLGAVVVDQKELLADIARLHRTKDAAYGDAWKRRGELVSIASNLARKVDRLERVAGGAPAGSESLFDTAIDLLVYCVKYELFIAEHDENRAQALFESTGEMFSDGTYWFDLLLARLSGTATAMDLRSAAQRCVDDFARLDLLLQGPLPSSWETKFEHASRLTAAAYTLVVVLSGTDARGRDALRREVAGEK